MTIISACNHSGRHGDEAALFAGMDSLLEAAPESALTVLTRLQPKVDSISDRSLSMRQRMHLASARNKLYLQMPSDSAFREVVDYYDRHGSANDCMKAHYLLGCIYRDRKEAPQAIRCYQDAIGCADTLSVDCDYATLLRVYSQMGDIFYYQYLPERALECYQQQSHYALKAKDTYNYIRGIELQIQPYYLLKDSTSMLAITDSAYHLYMSHNMPEHAARVFPCAIYIHLNRKEYAEARELMDQFELKSGLFDDEGNIVGRGYERYDYARGLYSLGQGKPDKAMEYFQRLQKHGLEQEAYDGFARIYRLRANPDSTYTYLELSDKKLDAQLKEMQTQAVKLVSSMYDYNRLEQQSEKDRQDAEEAKRQIRIISLSAFLLLTTLYIVYHRKMIKRKREITNIRNSYSESLNAYEAAMEEQHTLMASYKELHNSSDRKDVILRDLNNLMEKKNKKISLLQQTIEQTKQRYGKYLNRDKWNEFQSADSVKYILSSLKPFPNPVNLNDEVWDRLFMETNQNIPTIYELITKGGLTKAEQVTALLVLLGVTTADIALFLGTSAPSISRFKSNVNKKLFKKNDTKTLDKNLRKVIKLD